MVQKLKNIVETSSLGSEFIVLNIETPMTEGLRYKFRMFRVLIDSPVDVFCDNKSVVINSSFPEPVLSKKQNSVYYHRVWEDQTVWTIRVVCIEGEYNKADIAMKTKIQRRSDTNLSKNI